MFNIECIWLIALLLFFLYATGPVSYNPVFSPLGKLADQAIYFACHNFSLFFKLSENISASTGLIFTIFHQMESICVNFIDLDLFLRFLKGRCHANQFFTNLANFIQHAGVLKWIRLSRFWFKNIQWQYFFYILWKFDHNCCSNPRDYEGKNYTFLDKMAKIGIFVPIISVSAGLIVTTISVLIDRCMKIIKLA